jgi:hypothetical protein
MSVDGPNSVLWLGTARYALTLAIPVRTFAEYLDAQSERPPDNKVTWKEKVADGKYLRGPSA